jgi:AcrR family transcriptional regulator
VKARLSAAERREKILEAAGQAFSRGGYAGTSTDAVALEAGVSQPYVVRMFGSKADLFLEVFDRAVRALLSAFAAELSDPATAARPDVWERLEVVYHALIADRSVLMVLLQGFSAAPSSPVIAEAARGFVSSLFTLLVTRTGCAPARAQQFIANGMLLNTLLAMDAPAHVQDDPALAALSRCALGEGCGPLGEWPQSADSESQSGN